MRLAALAARFSLGRAGLLCVFPLVVVVDWKSDLQGVAGVRVGALPIWQVGLLVRHSFNFAVGSAACVMLYHVTPFANPVVFHW